ncbi:MAG: TonB-dependent receptor, partial [Bacteroidales bacterium]
MKKLFISLILIAAGIQSLTAQNILEAKIIDQQDGTAVANAQISVLHQNQRVLSDENGMFQLKIVNFPVELLITHLSYKDTLILCTNASSFASLIEIQPAIIDLEEVNILDGLAREGISPLSFTQVKADKIQSELGDKPLPEILSFTPGVYASRDGGGSGDANINMRGFGQENISVLLNGIPINGAENGLVYWNNWIGLTDVADGLQVQKGIGASLVANQSVGGTINIITMKPAERKESVISFQTTDYGNTKTTF